jgi:hypothetical protein
VGINSQWPVAETHVIIASTVVWDGVHSARFAGARLGRGRRKRFAPFSLRANSAATGTLPPAIRTAKGIKNRITS